MTASDLPTRTSADEALGDEAMTLTLRTGRDGAVTVSVAGEVDTFTAPTLRSAVDAELERRPPELVLDLRGVRFLGSAGLALLVQTQKSADSRGIVLRLIATTRPVIRPLEVTGLRAVFTISGDPR
ncbi:STAS domain-containing protein [Geodermatophilus sp. CPCC 206100]|uniref:STAS domain-containing protein n=1 Tax=Geodermatophilus sp. CPCC 206100 TaxID=3020054 RepID=UPI003B00E9FB